MSNSDSNPKQNIPDQTEVIGQANTDRVPALDATSNFESATARWSPDVTASFDSDSTPRSAGSGSGARSPSGSSASLIGTVIGGYRLVAPLGQGGMGRVFRADDSSGRPVAIKLLSPDLARSEEALARFKQEGLIASQINHSRCVFVHRVDEDGGMPFIAMELMTGLTLKDLVIQKGPLPFSDAIRLILQCIDGLLEAHSRGMIHRDIKPANCYLDAHGDVKIGDFGLARSLVSDSELTQTGAFIGTPLFASPEQLLGQQIDERSDIYSLTSTLYFLLAGKAPFESPHAAQVIARIASSDPPPFSSVNIDVPEELERIVMTGLARDPAKRYQSIQQMQSDLLALLAPKPETASLGRRVVAGLADNFLMSLVIGVLSILFLPPWLLQDSKIGAKLIATLVTFIYFFAAEAIFSTSLGKAALRIRVTDSAHGRRASVIKILVRTLSYALLGIVFDLIVFGILYFSNATDPLLNGFLSTTAATLPYLLLASTWLVSGRRQLLHDWLSGTECRISVPPVVQITQIALPDYAPPALQSHAPLPAALGRFQVMHEITAPGAENIIRWLSAEDPQLERSVWIALTDQADLDYEKLQCNKDPSTRLRFIEQGTTDSFRWFAYVAPEGVPLTQCLPAGVHFAWPMTSFVFRQLLNYLQSITSGGRRMLLPRLSDWWIDRAGRLSVVSLDTASCQNTTAMDPNEYAQQNFARYRELIQAVSTLALPPTHKLRKRTCARKSGDQRCLLERETLPPLRSISFCEHVAAGGYTPSASDLELQLVRLNKGNHCVNSKVRFFNSLLSLSFSIPLLATSSMLLILPSISRFSQVRSDVQHLKTLEYIASNNPADSKNWESATDEQKAYWSSQAGIATLRSLVEAKSEELRLTYKNLGKVEQAIAANFSDRAVLTNPPIYKLPVPPADQESLADFRSFSIVPIRSNRQDFSIRTSDTGVWTDEQMQQALTIANTSGEADSAAAVDDTIQSIAMWSPGLLSGLALWCWLTFGGLATRITGICFVSRDGNRMGWLRSAWRAALLFTPIILLVLLVAMWPLQSANDIWWTTLFKRVLLFAPLAYLASTLIWNNKTLADILSGTTAIPR